MLAIFLNVWDRLLKHHQSIRVIPLKKTALSFPCSYQLMSISSTRVGVHEPIHIVMLPSSLALCRFCAGNQTCCVCVNAVILACQMTLIKSSRFHPLVFKSVLPLLCPYILFLKVYKNTWKLTHSDTLSTDQKKGLSSIHMAYTLLVLFKTLKPLNKSCVGDS